ncbi:hypothetical protein [Niastella yeongjuensis]|nr:hypothetical protein [Niastella yeongjuensis]
MDTSTYYRKTMVYTHIEDRHLCRQQSCETGQVFFLWQHKPERSGV